MKPNLRVPDLTL